MNKNNKKGFTLVELLAVIVILAIILIIAVPKIMETIKNAKIGSMESSAKLIAKSLETNYQVSLTNGEGGTLSLTGSCLDAKIVDIDLNEYESCTYTITDGKAKVTLKGKDSGKFAGLTCTDATKVSAECIEDNNNNDNDNNTAAETLISQLDNNIGLAKLLYDSEWNEIDDEDNAIHIDYRFMGSGDSYEYSVSNFTLCNDNFNAETGNDFSEDDILSLCNGGEESNGRDINSIIKEYDVSYENISNYISRTLINGEVKNYVTFNNELWRIIGMFKDTSNNYQLKIIKDTKIDDLVWDSSNKNIWNESTIYTSLSTTYYNSLTSTAKEMIDINAKFNNGGVEDSDELTAKEAYKNEKSLLYQSIIGITTVSDYGYAASLICRGSYSLSNYDSSDCISNNWLYRGDTDYWLMNKESSSDRAWYVHKYGFAGIGDTEINFNSQPVLFLKSNVEIISGTGKSTDPYILKLN